MAHKSTKTPSHKNRNQNWTETTNAKRKIYKEPTGPSMLQSQCSTFTANTSDECEWLMYIMSSHNNCSTCIKHNDYIICLSDVQWNRGQTTQLKQFTEHLTPSLHWWFHLITAFGVLLRVIFQPKPGIAKISRATLFTHHSSDRHQCTALHRINQNMITAKNLLKSLSLFQIQFKNYLSLLNIAHAHHLTLLLYQVIPD